MAKNRNSKVKAKVPGKSSQGHSRRKEDLFQEFEQIFELMKKNEILEFEWEKNGEKFRAKGISPQSSFQLLHDSVQYTEKVSQIPVLPSPASAAAQAKPTAALASHHKQVLSPFVGTFYRSPSPEAQVYVREGQTIKRGDVLCIIEAMKLMNEIEAEFPGKIVSVLVENGQPVEFGEPLYIVDVMG